MLALINPTQERRRRRSTNYCLRRRSFVVERQQRGGLGRFASVGLVGGHKSSWWSQLTTEPPKNLSAYKNGALASFLVLFINKLQIFVAAICYLYSEFISTHQDFIIWFRRLLSSRCCADFFGWRWRFLPSWRCRPLTLLM